MSTTRTIYLNDALDEWLRERAVKGEHSLSWTIVRILANAKYQEEQELIHSVDAQPVAQ